MKKIISIIVFVFLLFIIGVVFPNCSQAAYLDGNDIIKINGKTVKSNSTITEVNSLFGYPKVTTDSPLGGKCFSYFDTSYSYYMYLETSSTGKIICAGGISKDFITPYYKYGEDEHEYARESANEIDYGNPSKVCGAIEYYCNSSERTQYWNVYKSDSSNYLSDLQKHSIHASKALAVVNGKQFNYSVTSETIFNKSEQLKKEGTDLREHSLEEYLTNKIQIPGGGGTIRWNRTLPNPIRFSNNTKYLPSSNDLNMVLYDYNVDKERYYAFFIDPSFISSKNTVELTADEKSKLNEAQKYYNEFAKIEENNIYDGEPNYSGMPLNAGKVKKTLLNKSTHLLNVIRAGAGLSPLSLDEEIADSAQHKAVLVYYNNKNGLQAGHNPEKPAGLSDDFYNKAMSYPGENLYMGLLYNSIFYALNDSAGNPINCGHRYNLLSPTYTKWGIGTVGSGLNINYQSCHKFSGYNNNNMPEVVAWPSNGIVMVDAVLNTGIGNWSTRFYNDYKITADTEVTIENLCTGKKYDINNSNKNDTGKLLNVVSEKQITFNDSNITVEAGDVFKITLHNVKDCAGNNTDYSYRSVIYKFKDESSSSSTPTQPSNPTNPSNPSQPSNPSNPSNPNSSEQKLPFKDVSNNDWFYGAVKYTYENGIISGYNTTTFAPNDKLTRAMIVTILYRMENAPDNNGKSKFADVSSNEWYSKPIKWAVDKGIIHGYGGTNNFGPNDNIIRQDLAGILRNYARYKNKDMNADKGLSGFKDYKTVDDYALTSIQWAVSKGVITGNADGTLNPKGNATRAETAAMITKYIKNVGR